MKFKEIIEDNRLLDDIRFNPNTVGRHILKSHIEKADEDKKTCGAMNIFSLMIMSPLYSDALEQTESKKPTDIVKKMIENTKEGLEEYSGEKYGL